MHLRARGDLLGGEISILASIFKYLYLNYLQEANEVCWDEPREQCTEQKVRVARKWCPDNSGSTSGGKGGLLGGKNLF